ncbi:MFS transporter [Dyella subtropica]|uniref:MFS transporter n=1 Tax=Dyella subtropica TaxID=2992127 RepID=UPI00224D0B65|nr:MFS transporter [Dyella subtropica]
MIPRSPGHLLYATIFVLTAIEYLQSGMTAFAAGPIMGEVSITPEDFSLIAAVYASVAILVISMQRWLVERLGGHRFIQCATAISVIGSVLCATSDDFQSFLIGRIVMALGGGPLFTAARMMIHHWLAGPKRLVGIKFLATGLALSTAAAPWLASLAVSHETWSAIYWLLAVLGLLAFALGSIALPAAPITIPEQRSASNPWLQLLLAGGSFVLLYALQRVYYDFYSNTASLAVAIGAAVLALMIYFQRQRDSAHPLLHVREMLHTRYLAGLALFMFAYVMLGANNYIVPMMLQRTLGYSWETAGYFQTLGLGFAVVTWAVMSQILPRYPSPRKYIVTGFIGLATFGALLAGQTSSANLWLDVLPALAMNSVFVLTVLPVTAMQTFRQMEDDESVFSNAQQVKSMLSQAGIALGVTLATLGQQWRTTVHYGVLNAQVNPDNPIYAATVQRLQDALASTVDAGQAAAMATAQVAQMLAQQASMLANIDHFKLIAVLGILGVLVTLVQKVFR